MDTRHWQTLGEALTEREQAILQLIAAGRSNSEIAAELVIALETVKWYNRRIFSKLDVSNRSEAVARARELGLLDIDIMSAAKQASAPHNLPSATTPFIGRETELAELTQAITEHTNRLVTVLAPGGMGKTRLALETARYFINAKTMSLFPNGVYFVPLVQVSDAGQIVPTIAEQVGMQFYGSEPIRQQLLDYFREKRALLVLDNFEHLPDGTPLLNDLLHTAPGIQLIVTSREKLNLQNEAVFALRGLEYADGEQADDTLASGAVRLFMQHARLARRRFTLQAADWPYLARICRLVQGMPLGLILAAAWVEMLSLREIADEIAASLDFLESQSRDIPDRQRSIRAVFDHAWKRLSHAEQSAFMKLAVFRGGFTRRAAQTITGASLRTLQTLASKALITRVSEERFEIHELLRQYAEAELDKSGEVDTTRDAHSAYYLDAVAEREADIKGRRQTAALAEIASDFENVRVAWYRAVETGNITQLDRTLEALGWFCLLTASTQEGETLFQRAIDRLAPAPNAQLLPIWGKLVLRWLWIERWKMGSYQHRPDAEILIRQCLALAQRGEDELEIAHCLYALGDYVETTWDFATALTYLDQCMPIYESRGDLFHLAWVIHFRSYPFWMDHPDEYIRLQSQALELRKRIGDDIGASNSLGNISAMLWTQGRLREGDDYLAQSAAATHIFNPMSMWNRVYAAVLPLLRGDFESADHLAAASLQSAEKANYILAVYFSQVVIGLTAVLQGDYAAGLPHCEHCLLMTLANKPQIPTFACLGLVIAACGRGDMHEVRTRMAWLLQSPQIMTRIVYMFLAPIAVIVLYHEHRPERAAQMVGAAYHLFPEVRWHEQWALFARLREDLRTQLGDAGYEAALQRGQSLTIEAIVAELKAGE